jgi:secreted Zn-dependent insulinase-like peptidase
LAAKEIKKSPLDDRIYHYQELNNQLKVLLISDPNADKGAASLNVNVGSLDDPWDRQGLAHFLEHMLFLGTQKYPEADDYQGFISDHGGSHNAYTSSHNTNYYFDIDNNQLDAALDRFSQFFVAPLFDELYVNRERKAVHSEFQANFQDDYRRALDAYREAINPKHPESKFNVGSLETLADRQERSIREDLVAFYKHQYSAHKMALVVLGRQSIDELKAMVFNRFSEIPLGNTNEEKNKKIELFKDNKLPFEVTSKPLKELRQMHMKFIVPSIKEHYRKKPLYFIGSLLGDEGPGSLLSLLKEKGLAENLSVSHSDKHDGSAEFNVVIQLTEKGQNDRELIRSLVFFCIDEIKKHGVESWRYQEKSLLSQTAFQFQERISEIATVRRLSSNLHYYPAEDVIVGGYLMEDFDARLIKNYLSYLKPKNLLVSSIFPDADTESQSSFYLTPFSVNEISKKIKKIDKTWRETFSLPDKNPFIPDSIDLYEHIEYLQTPKRIEIVGDENQRIGAENIAESELEKSSLVELWAKQDLKYKVPRAKVIFRIETPYVTGDLKGAVVNAFFVELLQDQLNEYNYPAQLAGAALWLQANNRGIEIIVSGYDDKLHKLMLLFISKMENPEFNSQRFLQIKRDLIRHWRNRSKQTPYRQLYTQLANNLNPHFWSEKDKIQTLEKMTVNDLKNHAKIWRQGAHVQGLFYGNLDVNWLERWQSYAASLVLPGDKAIQPTKIRKLSNKLDAPRIETSEIKHNDNAVILYVQGLNDDLEDRAMMALLRQIMGSPFYHQLRTQQQLGYIVFNGSLRLKKVPGSVFVVQSPTSSTEELQFAIEEFLQGFVEELPDSLVVHKEALVTQLLDSPDSLSASADWHWSNIRQGNRAFNQRELLADAVREINSDQLKQYYRKVFLNQKTHLWQIKKPSQDFESQMVDTQKANDSVIPDTVDQAFYSYP